MGEVVWILVLIVLVCASLGKAFSLLIHAVVDELFESDKKDGSL